VPPSTDTSPRETMREAPVLASGQLRAGPYGPYDAPLAAAGCAAHGRATDRSSGSERRPNEYWEEDFPELKSQIEPITPARRSSGCPAVLSRGVDGPCRRTACTLATQSSSPLPKKTPLRSWAIWAKLTVWGPPVVWKWSAPVLPLHLMWAFVCTNRIWNGFVASLNEPRF